MSRLLLVSVILLLQAAVPAHAKLTWGQTSTMSWTHAAMVAVNIGQNIYLIGDRDALHIYNTASDSWSTGAAPPANQYGPAVALGGKIYLLGGVTGPKITGNCAVYDPSANSWGNCAALPSPRGAGAAAVLNGKIHLLGGRAYQGAVLTDINDHQVYDPAADSWHSAPPMPTARDGLSLVADPASGRLFAIGGFNSQTRNPSGKTEIYSSATKAWTQGAHLSTPRFTAGSVLVGGKIYFMGGSTTRAMYPTVEAYDVSSDSWATIGGLPAARPLESAVAVNGTIYATGGDLCQGDTCYKTNKFWTLKP
jgi:N-acetylneuraminic acid mutarotase